MADGRPLYCTLNIVCAELNTTLRLHRNLVKCQKVSISGYSIVIYPNSVNCNSRCPNFPAHHLQTLMSPDAPFNSLLMTTLWLARFDGRIELQGPFLKKLAPRSLPKISAIFSRGPNLKWLPGLTKMSIKNDFEQLCHQ